MHSAFDFFTHKSNPVRLQFFQTTFDPTAGLGFVTLQTLSYQGYIQVDHVKMKKQVLDFFDFNEDGKIDGKDRSVATRKVMEVLQFNLPAGGGFGAGFIGGLRSG
jgi:uncharacterized membrane protein (Fun14 family)